MKTPYELVAIYSICFVRDTNCSGHLTKLAGTPMYGKNPLNIFLFRTRILMALGLGMQHCGWQPPTVSHFSYVPLIKCKITQKIYMLHYSETTSIKCIYICISHRNFIMTR